MKESPSFLVIQTAFIGDVILATGILETLHQRFPSASIDFLVRKGNESLVEGHPYLREVIVFDKSKKYRNLLKLIGKIRRSRYDYVINVQRFATTGLITALSGAGCTIGFDKNPLSFLFSRKVQHHVGDRHEMFRNHELIEWLAGGSPSKPRLYPSMEASEKARGLASTPYITVSPASVWFTKQFPAEQWIVFLKKLPASIQICLLGSKDDVELCRRIAESVGSHAHPYAGGLTFLESAALMKDAVMNYVNDSAPMHLASAVNAPVTAVYCSTVPSFGFGPLSDVSFVVESPEKLDCRPCGLHGFKSCPQGHFRCATSITSEQLQATLLSKSTMAL